MSKLYNRKFSFFVEFNPDAKDVKSQSIPIEHQTDAILVSVWAAGISQATVDAKNLIREAMGLNSGAENCFTYKLAKIEEATYETVSANAYQTNGSAYSINQAIGLV